MPAPPSSQWGQQEWGAIPWGLNYPGSFPQTIDFGSDGIASAEAWGSPIVTLGSLVLPTGIASAEAWGAPKIAGPVKASAIASSEAWGSPKLSLTIYPASIPSSEAWGTPGLGRQVLPTGIPSGEAWGSPKLSLTVYPNGIPSSEAWGSPHIGLQHQFILPPGIPSGEAWGSLDLAGPIAPLGIPSQLAFGLPKVAGPISVTGIPSAEAWGTPLFNVHTNVTLTAIPPGEAWGTPSLRNTLLVAPSGIPSAEAWGAPTLAAGPQRVFLGPILTGETWGVPALTGGQQAAAGLQIFIGGFDYTPYLRIKVNPAQLRSQTLGRATLTFDIVKTTNGPQVGQTVLVMDYGVRRFAGCVSSVITDQQPTVADLIFHCTALDKSSIADRRVVFKTYAAGLDARSVLLDLVATFLPGEGVTTNNVAASGLGNLSTDMIFYGCSVRQAFDQIATDVGSTWWIDMNSDLNFPADFVSPPCPFQFFDGSANWRKLTIEQTLLDYRNKQWAVSDRNTVPGQGGPTSITVTETYTLPQPAAQAAGFQLGALILDMSWTQIVSLKVNGVAMNFLPQIPSNVGYNLRHVYWGFPASPYIYPPNAANNTPAFPNPPGGSDPDPMAGDVVEVKYISTIQTTAVQQAAALAPAVPNLGGGFGTCGSGTYEAVEQVKGITSIEDLNAIAEAVLARSGGMPTILLAETDVPGAFVGQTLHVNLVNAQLPNTDLIITEVDWVHQPVNLGHGSALRWSIKAQKPTDLGNWIKWYERLIGRTQNAIPLDRFETGGFVLAPGSSLAAGLVSTNPYIVKHTGQLNQVALAATTPPSGQDLVLDITADGASIFQPGKGPVLRAGQTSVVIVGAAAFAVSYLFRNQVLRITASYRVTSTGATAQASGVSCDVQWVY